MILVRMFICVYYALFLVNWNNDMICCMVSIY